MMTLGFRPLAGCGLFPKGSKEDQGVRWSFRPLAGCGLFLTWTVENIDEYMFPSPCGVWVVSAISDARPASIQSFRPLAGCGLFRRGVFTRLGAERFRPLAGCGLFLLCIVDMKCHGCFRPLAGCGLFL